jgi:hypothetical protein
MASSTVMAALEEVEGSKRELAEVLPDRPALIGEG